jgi:hypothetical protein
MSACGLKDIVCTSSSPENFAGSFNKNARKDRGSHRDREPFKKDPKIFEERGPAVLGKFQDSARSARVRQNINTGNEHVAILQRWWRSSKHWSEPLGLIALQRDHRKFGHRVRRAGAVQSGGIPIRGIEFARIYPHISRNFPE